MNETPTEEAPQCPPEVAALSRTAVRLVPGPDAHGHGTVWRRWGAGPPVILLHGSAGSWTHWVRNIDALSAAHSVLVPDLPGFGDSPLPEDRTLEGIAHLLHRDLDRLLDAAARPALVGFSLGSVVAEVLVRQRPTRFGRLVLVRATFDGQGPRMPAGLRSAAGLDARAALEAHRSNLQRLMLADPASACDLAVAVHARNSRNARLDPRKLVPAGAAPARLPATPHIDVVVGAEDALAGGTLAVQRAHFLDQHPGGSFHVVPGAGHWVQFEAPQSFNAHLLRLLATPPHSSIERPSMSPHHPRLALFIDGTWIDASTQGEPVLDPSTGQVLGQLPHATAAQLDQALDAARRAFPAWRDRGSSERARILRGAGTLLRERSERIATIMSLEQGKPMRESLIEVGAAADVFDWSAEQGRRLDGRVVPARAPGWRQQVLRQPIGVVAAFTPWNFPAMIPARKIAGALSAGCCCVLKPSEETPGTALELARALQDAGLPPGVLNIVFGVPADVSARLVASPIVRKVSFTGSVAVGRHISGLAAQRGVPATMELGGHAPVLVFDDVDVGAVARLCAASKFRNAGQVCISPTRFIVHRSVEAAFVEQLAAQARAIRVGPALDADTAMGPLASRRRVAAVQSLVDDAIQRGAHVAAGGAALPGDGFFFAPTVLHRLPADSRALHEEPFGPLALVQTFDDDDQAFAMANALSLGLAAYAFTTDADRVVRIGDHLEAGMVGINTFMIATAETPFGGVKDSGHGREGGLEGTEAYTEIKYIAQAPSIRTT